MRNHNKTHLYLGAACLFLTGLAACSGRPVNRETASEEQTSSPSESQGSESSAASATANSDSIIGSLSRLQTRLEELDAKIAALSDKVDANKITLDNLSGTKPLETTRIGAPKTPPHSSSPVAPPAEANVEAMTIAFTQAMGLFRNGKYPEAVLAFNAILEKHPQHILAGSAQYYVGECYFLMGEYKLAYNEYMKVIHQYESSPRVVSALVRASHSLKAAGEMKKSETLLASAVKNFPGNPSLEWSSGLDHRMPSISPIEPPTQKEKTSETQIAHDHNGHGERPKSEAVNDRHADPAIDNLEDEEVRPTE